MAATMRSTDSGDKTVSLLFFIILGVGQVRPVLLVLFSFATKIPQVVFTKSIFICDRETL